MTQSFWKYLLFALLAKCGVSASSSTLDVETSLGTFRGLSNTTSNLEEWLGIPYVEPPVGNLRFEAPVPLRPLPGITPATHFGDACPQPVSANTIGVNVSENCLTLNIFRQEGTPADANLPVLVWLFPGGYMTGAASDPQWNPKFLINRSVTIGKPLIFVTVNYRLNTFGFLASSHVQTQNLNLGLQDQRQALIFVKNEISKFGGDPEKVTIWGQSAGGGSVEAAFLFPPETSLFRAGIIDSSTGPFKSAPFAAQYDAPGKPFSNLVEAVGCPLSAQSVPCLKTVPFDILLNASNTLLNSILNQQLWQPTPGGLGNLVTERPSQKIASDNFLRLPLIWGTNLNEGAGFSLSVLGLPKMAPAQEAARFDQFIGELILDNNTLTTDVLDEFNTLYPANDPSLGGAFNTGDSLFDRAEAWYTDIMYLAPRRLFFNKAAPTSKLFAYFFTQFIPGNNRTLGVFHGSELELIFGDAPRAPVANLSTIFTDAYITFVTDLDPGSFWPQYNLQDLPVLQLMQDNITVIPDTFNLEKTEFHNSLEVLNEFEK